MRQAAEHLSGNCFGRSLIDALSYRDVQELKCERKRAVLKGS